MPELLQYCITVNKPLIITKSLGLCGGGVWWPPRPISSIMLRIHPEMEEKKKSDSND